MSSDRLGRRDKSLLEPDDKLLAECTVETYRASGPGGQHRNKTESAIRLTHRPTGVVVTATERRSQHENRRHAVSRLRRAIAMRVREPVISASPIEPGIVKGTAAKSCHSERSEESRLSRGVKARFFGPQAGLRMTACSFGNAAVNNKAAVLADPAWPRVSQKSDAYLPAAAAVLDYLEACRGKLSDAAGALGVSTASLAKFLSLDDDLWTEANRLRRRFGEKPLR